jgi:hypothetical protein
MNHQAIIDQLSTLAPQLKAASAPEDVLIKYASDNNLSVAQLERIGQIYNIAKTLNFMDKSASRGDSFKVLDNEKMLAQYTQFKPKQKSKEASNDWNSWFEAPLRKSASDASDNEKSAIIKEEDGKYTVYSEDGSKRLSKPGTKEEAVKRLRQVEYFKKHKKANTVPNIMAMANDELYSSHVSVADNPLQGTTTAQIKAELQKESSLRYELETTNQIISDAEDEVRKIASELLEMHRLSPLPFADMERDAVYCSDSSTSIKKASDVICNIFQQKGWSLDRYDFNTAVPRLVKDRHNVLPLFKSAAENIELIAAASSYKEELLKQATLSPPPRNTPVPSGQGQGQGAPFVDFDVILPGRPSRPKRTQDDDNSKNNSKDNKDKELTADLTKAIKTTADPDTYLSNVNKVPSMVKEHLQPSKNVRQEKIDNAFADTKRLAVIQSLLLTDPIIGEADPDMVLDLYNTLATANPEIVADKNLLKFALREALQYEAIPLHTYKDLISMGKDRAMTQNEQHEFNSNRYRI